MSYLPQRWNGVLLPDGVELKPGYKIVDKFGRINNSGSGSVDVNIYEAYDYGAPAQYDWGDGDGGYITKFCCTDNSFAGDIEINGIDSSGDEQTETQFATGNTFKTMTHSYRHINRVKIQDSEFTGECYFTPASATQSSGIPDLDDDKKCVVTDEFNQTQQTLYMSPNGYDAYLLSWGLGVGRATTTGTKEVDAQLNYRSGYLEAFKTIRNANRNNLGQGEYGFSPPVALSLGSDIQMRWNVSQASANNTSVHGWYDLLLIPNT